MKSTINDSLCLTTNEIAILLNLTRQKVYNTLFERNVKAVYKNEANINYYSIKDIRFIFDIVPIIPIVKKPKKPYFEFSSVIVESKINQHGTD